MCAQLGCGVVFLEKGRRAMLNERKNNLISEVCQEVLEKSYDVLKDCHKYLRGIGYGAVLAAGALGVGFGQATPAQADTPPNIIFFLVDDLGWTDFNGRDAYGTAPAGSENDSVYHYTPTFKQLCNEGIRFTQAYAACPFCGPTRASILTGKYPASVGMTNNPQDYPYRNWGGDTVAQADMHFTETEFVHNLDPAKETTFATVLQDTYDTCFIGKWHQYSPVNGGSLAEHGPEEHGFDYNIGGSNAAYPHGGTVISNYGKNYYRGNSTWDTGYYPNLEEPNASAQYEDVFDGTDWDGDSIDDSFEDCNYLTDALTYRALEFIEYAAGDPNTPFLLYMSHYGVHIPIQAKDGTNGTENDTAWFDYKDNPQPENIEMMDRWKFDETTGTNASDWTGASGYDGTVVNATWVAGKFGNALDFDGDGDYVHFGTDPVMETVRSISLWVNPDSVTDRTDYPIGLKADTRYIKITDGTVTAEGFTSPTIYIDGVEESPATISAGTWSHIVVTTETLIDDVYDAYIGRQGSDYFNGKIDDVQVYAYALNEWQITCLYTNNVPEKESGVHDDINYAAMIMSIDESLGRIKDKLVDEGIDNNTIIIFYSDNGGYLGYKDVTPPYTFHPTTSNHPLRSGKKNVFEGGTRVPLVIWGPNDVISQSDQGTSCDVAVTSPDFFPTILAWAGVNNPVSDIDGESVVALLEEPDGTTYTRSNDPSDPDDDGAIYWHVPHYRSPVPFSSIIQGDYKLIRFYESDEMLAAIDKPDEGIPTPPGLAALELYDLSTDIDEGTNLASSQAAIVADMEGKLNKWLNRVDAVIPAGVVVTGGGDTTWHTGHGGSPNNHHRGPIQDAILGSGAGDTITIYMGKYSESIVLDDDNIAITSAEPDNLNAVNMTIIEGVGASPTVTFEGGSQSNVTGLTITHIKADNLLAHWRLDTGTGTEDSTGNYDGTLIGTPTWPAGQFEEAVDLDGIDDCVDVGAGPSTVRSVALWVNPDANDVTEYPLDLNGTQYIKIASGAVSAEGFTSATIYIDGSIGTTIEASEWNHIVVTTETAINASDLDIGRKDTSYFAGLIDDVRLYERVLSTKEMGFLANQPEIAHWRFDETTGTTAYDSAGNNNGTVNGASWDETGGQIEGALDFDGSDDYVEVADDDVFDFASSADFSIAFWFQASLSNNSGKYFIGHNDGSNGFYVGFDSSDSGKISLGTHSGRVKTTQQDWNSFQWYHIVAVNHGSDGDAMYVNGALDGSGECNYGGPPSAGEKLTIGRKSDPNYYFDGKIDDVRIYDRALSSDEIQLLLGGYAPGIKCDTSSPTISKCVIRDNDSDSGNGSGIYCTGSSPGSDPAITNCIIIDNVTEGDGGGIYCNAYSDPIVTNCTIVGNSASPNNGGGIYASSSTPTITNSIIWDNGDDLYGCSATYSCIEDGDGGTGNISSNPSFVDEPNDNYHLKSDSPCINAGDSSGNYSGLTDMDGDTRVLAGRVDIGADEAFQVYNSTGQVWYVTINAAIDAADANDVIVAHKGTFTENVDFDGKAITVRSTNVDWDTVLNTIINGNGVSQAVYFHNGEGSGSILQGFTVTNGLMGINCLQTSPQILNCFVRDNTYDGIGSTTSGAPTIKNCVVANNPYNGIVGASLGSPIIRNCTIFGNGLRGIWNNMVAPTISNCIVWDNGTGDDDDLVGCTATYSCVQEDWDDDPLLGDPNNYDYHLDPNSWCVDVGDPNGVYSGELDIDFGDRTVGPVDIGADEYDPNS